MTPPGDFLSVRRLGKTYGVPVLSEVDLDLRRGEVHALVGENGAGKSTLSRILAGLTRADQGEMTLAGATYAPRNKRAAELAGVRIVLQELNLLGSLTVAENLFLGALPHRWGWIDRHRLEERARSVLSSLGVGDLEPGRRVGTLGIGHQQMVAIAAGLTGPCALLILDEPTAALTGPETERLFAQIDRLRREGTSVLYISHRLEEVLRISDRVTVLRDGRLIATRPAIGLSADELIRLMVGRSIETAAHRPRRQVGGPALTVEGLRRDPAVKEVSFAVHRGEILGISGLMGSGRTETVRAIFGADRPDEGRVCLGPERRPVNFRSPRAAVRAGVALLTEDRKAQGLLLPWSIRANLSLFSLPQLSGAGGWIDRRQEQESAAEWARSLGVRCRSHEQPVGELSGGNQQKVVMARWLARRCEVLLFDEPTRGIDVGARAEIYRLLEELAGQGKAIVLVSSDLRELMELCDRIVVMSAGRVAGTFGRGEWSEEGILAAALSGYQGGA